LTHEACCDAAEEAHYELAVTLQLLARAEHRARVLDAQLSEQIKLTEHLMEFMATITPETM
jgi:hypothetical protein